MGHRGISQCGQAHTLALVHNPLAGPFELLPAFHKRHYILGARGNLRRRRGNAQPRGVEVDAICVQKALQRVRSDGEVRILRDVARRLRQTGCIGLIFDEPQDVSACVEYSAAACQLNRSRDLYETRIPLHAGKTAYLAGRHT